jgi:hypothetical protein
MPSLPARPSTTRLAALLLIVGCGGNTLGDAPGPTVHTHPDATVDDARVSKTACIPGQSVACVGAAAYGPCDCPDGGSLQGDGGPLPDGYAPIPASLGRDGYNAIWAVNPAMVPTVRYIMRPLFSIPDCNVVPPYGDSYAAIFSPATAGPSGTFPACSQPNPGHSDCYEPQIYNDINEQFESVHGGQLVLSAFDSDGIATGTMDTAEGIVPLIVKNCP